jgi:hypothetical protein
VLALTVRPLGVLLVRCRHPHHAAHLPIATQPAGEYAQHTLRVEPVGFGPAGTSVHQDARRLQRVSGDTVRGQQPVQSESIPAGLKAAGYVDGAAEIG